MEIAHIIISVVVRRVAILLACFALCSSLVAQSRLAEPTWPQRFEIASGEGTGFGFVVSQPGPITVRAQWQGAPLVVSLSGPLAPPIEKLGNGSVDLSYNVTAQDVQ